MKAFKLSNGNLLISVVEDSPGGLVEGLVQIEPRTKEYKEYAICAIPMSWEDEIVFRLLHGIPVRPRLVN